VALSQAKLTRIIARRISRSMGVDQDAAMVVANEIREDINEQIWMDSEDEGNGIRPITQGREPERPTAPPPPANIMAPVEPQPVKSGKLILTPDDPEFKKPDGLKDTKVRSFPLRRVAPTTTPTKAPARKWWSSETLIQALSENTPAEIQFTPEGSKNVITAVRNILNQEGMDCVYLEYAHAAASRELGNIGRASDGSPTGAPNLPAVARVCFTLYDKELPLPESMESIMTQLRGMYKPRPQTLIPALPPDRPLRVADAAPENTAQEDTGLISGWNSVGPRVTLERPIPLSDGSVVTEVSDATQFVKSRVKQGNIDNSPKIPHR